MGKRDFLRGVVAGAGLLGVGLLAAMAPATDSHDPYMPLERFARVLSRIDASYVEPTTEDALVDAGIRGMVGRLDEHSSWLDAAEATRLREDAAGKYDGIGVEVRAAPDGFVVARIIPNGPAYFAGLSVGDRLLAANGESISGLTLDELALRLRGPRGEPIALSVLRQGWPKPRSISAIRDRVHSPAAEAEPLVPGVAYVHLNQFQRGAANELVTEVTKAAAGRPLLGLIVDLRDNPGGLLEEAVAVSDLFLDEGTELLRSALQSGQPDQRGAKQGAGGDLEPDGHCDILPPREPRPGAASSRRYRKPKRRRCRDAKARTHPRSQILRPWWGPWQHQSDFWQKLS